MTVLTRKISRAKWQASDGLSEGEIPADAVSADLRTTANKLSFWRCTSGEEGDLRNAMLAHVAAADRADRMDFAWVEEAAVREGGITTEQTPGRTPVHNLQHTHVDLVRLDVRRLGKLAELISDAIGNGNHCRITMKQVVEIVAEAVRSKAVSLDDLKPSLRDAVSKALNRADT